MRISEWARGFGIEVLPATAMPGETVYRVRDIFTTRDGRWDVSTTPGSVTAWARESYLKPVGHAQYFDDAGGATNLFGAVAGQSTLTPGSMFVFHTYADQSNWVERVAKRSGWANISLVASSAYAPDRGERGPWAWAPKGVNADLVIGGGLPNRWHVSTFVVWEAITEMGEETPQTEPDEGGTALAQDVAALQRDVARLKQLLQSWVGD